MKLYKYKETYYLCTETREHRAAQKKLQRLNKQLGHLAPDAPERAPLLQKLEQYKHERDTTLLFTVVNPADYPDAKIVEHRGPPKGRVVDGTADS